MGVDSTEAMMRLAATQHGAIGAGQLAGLGITRRWLDNLVRRSVLHRAGGGVYVVCGAAPTWHHKLTVGMLVLSGDAWVSHESAAALHRFDRALHEPVEFTVFRVAKGRGKRAPFAVHTTASLAMIDRVTVDGYRCTSATRTVIDLAHSRIPIVYEYTWNDVTKRPGHVERTLVERLHDAGWRR